MEISLLNPPAVTYSTSSNISSRLLKEESTEYGIIAKEDSIAVLGYVAAGEPIEGISVPLGYIAPPFHADYVLIAKGHSMEPVIHDGEYIFVKSCKTLCAGEIGIFYIDGEVTCKKYQPEQDCILLQSLNPDFKPFKYSLNENHDFKIQGKVVLTPEQKARLFSE